MNTSEFKAWFDGFTENLDKPPTAKQWKRIQERVKEIKDTPTSPVSFYRDYWPIYRPYYGTISGGLMNCVAQNSAATMSLSTDAKPESFINVSQTFSSLGRAEAVSIEA